MPEHKEQFSDIAPNSLVKEDNQKAIDSLAQALQELYRVGSWIGFLDDCRGHAVATKTMTDEQIQKHDQGKRLISQEDKCQIYGYFSSARFYIRNLELWLESVPPEEKTYGIKCAELNMLVARDNISEAMTHIDEVKANKEEEK